MFERFTEGSRSVVVLAQEESRLLNHNYIGTEHLLLGLVRKNEGRAYDALVSLGITLDKVREQVEVIIGRGESSPSGHLPFTPRAKRVLTFSFRESLWLGVNYIGTEHILLGLIHDDARSEVGPPVIAHVTLANLGVDLDDLRQAVLDILPRSETTPTKARTVRPALRLSEAFNDELKAKDQIIAALKARVADLERKLAKLTEPDGISE